MKHTRHRGARLVHVIHPIPWNPALDRSTAAHLHVLWPFTLQDDNRGWTPVLPVATLRAIRAVRNGRPRKPPMTVRAQSRSLLLKVPCAQFCFDFSSEMAHA
jgi:hypothetical protein